MNDDRSMAAAELCGFASKTLRYSLLARSRSENSLSSEGRSPTSYLRLKTHPFSRKRPTLLLVPNHMRPISKPSESTLSATASLVFLM